MLAFSGAVGLRQDGVMESSGGVDVMEEEEVEEEEEDENDDDDHDEEEDEGGSDMDEEGADLIDEDTLRIYEEEDIYLPFDEGSGQYAITSLKFLIKLSLGIVERLSSPAKVKNLFVFALWLER